MRLLVLALFAAASMLAGMAQAQEQHALAVGHTRGKFTVFATDSDRQLESITQIKQNAPVFSQWQNFHLEAQALGAPVVANQHNGGWMLFVPTDRGVQYRYALSNGGWARWTELPGMPQARHLSVFSHQDGTVEVFALGDDNHIFHAHQKQANIPNVWTAWERLSGRLVAGVPVVTHLRSGVPMLYVRGLDGILEVSTGTKGKAGVWGKLRPIESAHDDTSFARDDIRLLRDPVVGRNHDGRIELFAVTRDNTVVHRWQRDFDSAELSPWTELGGLVTSQIAVGTTWDGRLAVYARGGDNALWATVFDWDAGWREGWKTLGGRWLSAPVVAKYEDGRDAVLMVAKDTSVWMRVQKPGVKGDWHQWETIGGEAF